MVWLIPYPCCGPHRRVLRISMSSVPCSSSIFFRAILSRRHSTSFAIECLHVDPPSAGLAVVFLCNGHDEPNDFPRFRAGHAQTRTWELWASYGLLGRSVSLGVLWNSTSVRVAEFRSNIDRRAEGV